VRGTLADGFGAGVHLGWPHGIGADQPRGHMLTTSGVTVFGPPTGSPSCSRLPAA
jgi:hypothetical protein